MATSYHMKLDIEGFLLNNLKDRAFRFMFKYEDGRRMSPREAKMVLLDALKAGKKCLPFGDCEGFSYETGCPGHEVPAPVPIAEPQS